MKQLILIILSLNFILSMDVVKAQSSPNERPLNLDYSSILKEKRACRLRYEGCTLEESLELARFQGKVLSRDDIEQYIGDSRGQSVFIPLSLTNQELILLAASTSLGIVAFKYDEEIMDVVQKHKTPMTETLSSIGNFYGSPAFGYVAAGSYFLGMVYDNNKLKQVGLFTIAASVAQSIVTVGAKNYFQRERPIKGDGAYAFLRGTGDKSFYSGHTSEAFALATVLSEMLKEDYPVVPYVAYGLAGITAYARMHDQAHWASDVIAGAIMGHLITKLTINALRKNPENRSGFEFFPSYDPATGTFYVTAEWKHKKVEEPLKCKKLPEGMSKVDACLAEGIARAAKN